MNEKQCRKLIYARAEQQCERCGNTNRGLTVHHRIKRSQGGQWTPQNCVLLCGHGTTPHGCHSRAEHEPNAMAKEGYHVRPWQDLGAIPILYRDGETYLLDDRGEMYRVPQLEAS